MRVPRLYCPDLMPSAVPVALPDAAMRHAVQVLRLKSGAALRVFDGAGAEYDAVLTEVKKRSAMMQIGAQVDAAAESPVAITLLQAISRGERMDYALQKAVELGVHRIVPVETARCNVQLSQGRDTKRAAHWQGVMISACEQSGRAVLPKLAPIVSFSDALAASHATRQIMLDPLATVGWQAIEPATDVAILIGPEGGLDEIEIEAARTAGFIGIRFGPRILRTETATVAALAVVQTLWGDCG